VGTRSKDTGTKTVAIWAMQAVFVVAVMISYQLGAMNLDVVNGIHGGIGFHCF